MTTTCPQARAGVGSSTRSIPLSGCAPHLAVVFTNLPGNLHKGRATRKLLANVLFAYIFEQRTKKRRRPHKKNNWRNLRALRLHLLPSHTHTHTPSSTIKLRENSRGLMTGSCILVPVRQLYDFCIYSSALCVVIRDLFMHEMQTKSE